MESTPTSQRYNYLGVALLGLVFSLVGWGGLLYVINTYYPNGLTLAERPLPQPGSVWSYLAELDSGVMLVLSALVALAFAGLSLPFTWFLNRRFAAGNPRPWTIVRQGLWVGVFVAVLLWLRANQTFSVPLMTITAGALALVELLMWLRQRGAPA